MSEHDSLHKYDEHIAKYAKQEATMSEPIKLPPIPREWDHNGLHTWERLFTASVTQQYARLAVEQNTAALRAERDALRVELAAMTKRATAAEGYAEHMLTEARKTADVMAQAEAECDALVQATGASSVLEAIGIIRGNKAQLARLTTPNLYWIDGGESQVAEELCELADNIAADISGDDRECTVTVGCARELPSMQMRVWIDDEGSMNYDTTPLPNVAREAK